ncbi:MAG: hypothetical protein BWX45_01209 [Deltaproteobacteria bacterium ADurb.Bin002]|nr:MAG: hypothetical protein BWX45_01209 [Deltaproteobacteria bacterium ADurb.Bin002]
MKKNFRRFDKVIRIQLVGGDHGVNAEAPDAFVPADAVAFKKLFARESVFGFFRMADDDVPFFQGAGIVTAADQVRKSGVFFQKINVR